KSAGSTQAGRIAQAAFRMRILHVIESLDPAKGGPPFVAARLAAAQAQIGHEVQIVCYARPDRLGEIEQALGTIPSFDKIQLDYVTANPTIESYIDRDLRRHLTRQIRVADVVHLHG